VIRGLKISPSDLIVQNEAFKNSVFSSLKSRNTTDAKVLKVFSENKALVLIAGKKTVIKTPFPLAEGEKFQVGLLGSRDNQNVKTLPGKESQLSEKIISLIKLISKSNPFANLIKSGDRELLGMLKSLALNHDKTDKDFLARLMDKSGLLFEKKVSVLLKNSSNIPPKNGILDLFKNDIKGYVLNQLQAPGTHNTASLKALVEYSSNMENIQILNSLSSETGKYLIPFPVFANGSFSFGQLLLDLGFSNKKQKNKTRERIINISFLLNMSNIGALRADFSIYKKAISGVFKLSNPEICSYVKAMLPHLRTRLINSEYLVRNIECKVALKEDISPASFVESFVKDENRVLDIII